MHGHRAMATCTWPSVAMGANDAQAVKAMLEAEKSYDGPSLVIAYSPLHRARHTTCSKGLGQQKLAVDSGHWIRSIRYDPRLAGRRGQEPAA